MNTLKTRFPCEHGRLYSHYIRPVGPGKHPKCAGGTNVTLKQVEPPLYTDTETVWYEHCEQNDVSVWVVE